LKWCGKLVITSNATISMKLLFTFFLIALNSYSSIYAQTSTDLIVIKTDGKPKHLTIESESIRLLTDRPEYDNQPKFINEYQLVFSAADDQENNDIIVYNFTTDKFTNLTKTSDRSEFSPSITDCGMYISAVVTEPDKRQRIWLYPTSFEPGELLYDDIEPVGYYDWYDNKAAMFVLGDPTKLIYARGRNDIVKIDTAVGRSIHKRPDTSEITYLSMGDSTLIGEGNASIIKTFDIETSKRADIGVGIEGAQDFIWLDKNYLLMAKGSNIYKKKYNDQVWELLSTVSIDTHQNISRMAYSPDLNVLVLAMERKNK